MPLNCAKCGKEIQDKESSFCAYCGIPFDSQPKKELTTAAGILAMIAATFSVAVGTIGIVYHQSYIDYLTSYGQDTSGSIGFLLFATYALIASTFGFASGMLLFTKKRFKISVAGLIIMLASAIFTLIVVRQFGYGFTEGILLSGISIGAFSVISAVFTIKSRTEFAEPSTPAESEPAPAKEIEAEIQ